ncbi:MAG: hypothetical protein ABIZ49_13685 [Opitutaceae bacterium]
MNFPFHLFQLKSRNSEQAGKPTRVTTRPNVQWDKPVFRPPALPTPNQINNELPFTVNFPRSRRTAR